MNVTPDYNDDLDGDSLACKPGHAAVGIEAFCVIGLPSIGWLLVANGISFLYIGIIQHRRKNEIHRSVLPSLDQVPNAKRKLERERAALRYRAKLFCALGTSVLAYGLFILVHGFGTVYPTTHIRGQIGDAIGKFAEEDDKSDSALIYQ
jgi:hypothetical protein